MLGEIQNADAFDTKRKSFDLCSWDRIFLVFELILKDNKPAKRPSGEPYGKGSDLPSSPNSSASPKGAQLASGPPPSPSSTTLESA